eukprot:scaffold7476_cov538-Prasinococcus_capsulatus_cf.AAC.1
MALESGKNLSSLTGPACQSFACKAVCLATLTLWRTDGLGTPPASARSFPPLAVAGRPGSSSTQTVVPCTATRTLPRPPSWRGPQLSWDLGSHRAAPLPTGLRNDTHPVGHSCTTHRCTAEQQERALVPFAALAATDPGGGTAGVPS